jgi:hypothetical protein
MYMLSKISWSEFIIFFGVVLPLYYGIVISKYYRKEIMQLTGRINGRNPESSENNAPGSQGKST